MFFEGKSHFLFCLKEFRFGLKGQSITVHFAVSLALDLADMCICNAGRLL